MTPSDIRPITEDNLKDLLESLELKGWQLETWRGGTGADERGFFAAKSPKPFISHRTHASYYFHIRVDIHVNVIYRMKIYSEFMAVGDLPEIINKQYDTLTIEDCIKEIEHIEFTTELESL